MHLIRSEGALLACVRLARGLIRFSLILRKSPPLD